MSSKDRHNLERLRRHSARLNRMIEDGSLDLIPESRRCRIIGRIRRLCRTLSGTLPEAALRSILAAAAVLVLGIPACETGQEGSRIRFDPPAADPFGITTVSYYSFPALCDIDADGDLDLFLLTYDSGLLVFQNTGTAASPSFASPIADPFGLDSVNGMGMMAFVDIDADGDLDLFVESYSYYTYGGIGFHENTGAAYSPLFSPPVRNPFDLSVEDDNDFFAMADLDSDGDVDLLTATYSYTSYYDYEGLIRYYENDGTPSAPSFATPVDNPFRLNDLPTMPMPALADLDSDGDLDLLVSAPDEYDYTRHRDIPGGFDYLENRGSPVAPAFGSPSRNPFGLQRVGYFSVPVFADIDADGDADLFASGWTGDYYTSYEGHLFFFRNVTPATPD